MADWLLANTGNVTLTASQTAFMPLSGDGQKTTAETQCQTLVRASYTLSNLAVYVLTNASTVATTFRTRKNAANGALTFSIGIAATGLFEDTTHSDSLVAGDLSCYSIVTGAGAVPVINRVSTTLNDANGTPPQMAGDAVGISVTFGTTRYIALEGVPGMEQTEARIQDRYTTQTTMSRLRCRVSFNNSTTNPMTVTLRKNATALTNTVSIAAAATGEFEDTTHTDTLTAGDLVCAQAVNSGAAGGTSIVHIQVLTTQAARRMQSNFTRIATTQTFNVTAAYHIEGGTATDTEANCQLKTRVACVFKNLFFYTPTNTIATSASTCTLRVGGANSALTVSIGAGATGAFEDTTHSVTTTATDLINWQVVTPNTSGTLTLKTIAVEQTNPASGLPPGLGPYVGLDQPSRDFGAMLRM